LVDLSKSEPWGVTAGRLETGAKMQDFWMVVFTVVFFVLAFSYVQACQKLR
jgi:hypothetical protein